MYFVKSCEDQVGHYCSIFSKENILVKISCWLIGWLGPRQYVEQHLQDLLSGQHSVWAVHHELPPPFSGEITTGILHLKQLYNYICFLQPGDSFYSKSFIGFILKIAITIIFQSSFHQDYISEMNRIVVSNFA